MRYVFDPEKLHAAWATVAGRLPGAARAWLSMLPPSADTKARSLLLSLAQDLHRVVMDHTLDRDAYSGPQDVPDPYGDTPTPLVEVDWAELQKNPTE